MMRKIMGGVRFVLLVFLLGVVAIRPSQTTKAVAGNGSGDNQTVASAVAASSGCVTDWFVSYGGTTQYQLLWSDPDNVPADQLRFDWGYHDPYEFAGGYIDFNANSKSDIFSAIPRSDGALQWRYWDATTNGWTNLGYAYDPLDGLRFGDFNNDNKTDLFSTTLRSDGNYQWRYSSGGTASYTNLNYSSLPIQSLRFGDFNADGYTDVFEALLQPGGTYNWVYSPSGVGAFETFSNGESYNTARMLFGDRQSESVQGSLSDGITDIFSVLPNGGPFGNGDPQYLWRSLLVAQYFPATGGADRTALRVGNFDGDYYTDIFDQEYVPATKLYNWRYISGKDLTIHALNYGTTPVSGLHFGDFDGDRKTDVFLAVPRCAVYLPLLVK